MYGTEIELRTIEIKKDILEMYSIMQDSDQYLFSTKLSFNLQEQFEKWFIARLRNEFHDFRVICIDNKAVGFIHNYDFTLQDGHCKLAICINEEWRLTGVGSAAAIMFINELFDRYPLRKIYSTVYDYNLQSLQSNIRAGFVKEGYLEKFRYHNQEWHGMYYLSITREVFREKLGHLIND